MTTRIERRFPAVADMERAARRRIPRFAWDYLSGGIGREALLAENLARLDRVKLEPRYLAADADQPDLSHRLFGQRFGLPFGVAPLGLSGLIWPRASEHLARAARAEDMPFALSSMATSSIEQVGAIGGHIWYQHYPTVDESINRDMLERARSAGFEVLLVTVDIPTLTRRERDLRNGLSVPPRFDARTLLQISARPAWALAMLRDGVPEFPNLKPYLPEDSSLAEVGVLLSRLNEGHVSLEKLRWYREQWPGRMIVKGVLSADDAGACAALGADAIVVSNHGGRQLDAALTAADALPGVRAAVGADFPLLLDGGIRSGLDIARCLALGADFVLLGRALMFGLGALGARGAAHALQVLRLELRSTLGQLGCPQISRLPEFLVRRDQ